MFKRIFKEDLASADLDVAGKAEAQLNWRKRKPSVKSIAQLFKGAPLGNDNAAKDHVSAGTGSASALKAWMGKSVLVNDDGSPKVMYHGTTGDITEFKGGPIYLAETGKGASVYAQSFGYGTDETRGEKGNVMPLYARAEKPFDYTNEDHVNGLVAELEKAGDLGGVPIAEDEDYYPLYNNAAEALKAGDTYAYRSKVVQNAIEKTYDSFYSISRGVRNIAVFNPKQVKSALSNSGEYTDSKDITKADVKVVKANPYRAKDGRWASKDNAATVTSMGQDMERQAKWLTDRAKEMGHPDMDTLAHKDMSKFFELTKKWRRTHAFKLESVLNFKLF